MATIVSVCLVVGLAVISVESSAPTRNRGYWIAGANAQVFAYGDAALAAPSARRPIRGQIEDIAAHPGGRGYWLLGQDGGVYPYGTARDHGQAAFREQNAAAIASSPSGDGYLVASELGEVRAFGDAVTRGSLERRQVQRRIVDIAATPSGAGYWLVDAAGQVFAFGDAVGRGSVPRGGGANGGQSDVVAMAATADGAGYWIVAASGEVFPFGSARRLGSAGGGRRIVDMTATHTGLGYWLVDRDGAVLAFGDAVHHGQLGRGELRSGLITAIVSTPFVNRAPVATDDSASLDEDTFADIDVLANDTDEDGDPLTADLLTQPAHGAASRNADGTLRYVPAPNYNGPDSFRYRVVDGFGGSADGTVTLTVRPVNDPPVASADAYTTDEDVPLDVGAPGVLGNDSDIDGDRLAATVSTPPSHGRLTLLPDGSLRYASAPNYHGPDSFTYELSDGQGGTATATVRITIVSVPDAPIASEDAFATDEDTALAVSPPGVLGNDSDGDGDAIGAILVTGPAHGTLTLDANGALAYTPDPDFNGDDAFSYRASDGTLSSDPTTARITVRPVNDTPVASSDRYEVDEDGVLAVAAPGVLGNDTDIDGDALSAELVATTIHGTLSLRPDGSFTYAPAANFFGSDSFRYAARDAALASAAVTVTITVRPVNDAPQAAPDSYTVDEDWTLDASAPGVLGNDTDIDSPSLTATIVSAPAHGSLVFSSDGSFGYVPDPNFNGADAFVYRASDGALESGDTTVEIRVLPVNDPPVAVGDAYTVAEDGVLAVASPGVLANDTDVDGDALGARVVTYPDHGDLILENDGSFTYVPAPNYNGPDQFTYRVSDGIETSTATVTLTVTAVADPPNANDDAYGAVVGTPLTVPAPGVLANDSAETGTLTAVLVTAPAHGTLTLAADGSFSYTTSLTAAGTDSFTYKARAGTEDSAPATVTITVSATGGGSGGGGGGGGTGTFGGFAPPTLTVWDFDAIDLRVLPTTLRTKLGRVVPRYGSAWYVPDRGARGHDSFTVGGRRFEIDVLSDVWGD